MSAGRPTGPLSGGPLHVATTNAHKAEEIRAILAPLGIEVRRPEHLEDVIEDGDTFQANARLKARAAARALGAPALADDSGLVVDVLGGAPGIHSARYAGEGAGDAANNALLIERLSALGVEDPHAAFVCHVVIAAPDGEILAEAEGRVEGVLRWPEVGGGGFGYDPLFFHPPSGCRLSELSREAKNAVSHRGRALRALADILQGGNPA
jgi:XTP/dITP diphosphohydrolase